MRVLLHCPKGSCSEVWNGLNVAMCTQLVLINTDLLGISVIHGLNMAK